MGIYLDLTTQAQNDGAALGDLLSGIEQVNGTSYDDTLLGDATANWLSGGLKDDVIDGRGGEDVIEGGGGADELWGGAAADEFVLERDDAWLDHQSYWPHDQIKDFQKLEGDKLAVFKSEFGVTDLTFKLESKTTAQATLNSGATFVFETDASRLWFDADGKGRDTDQDGIIDENLDSILIARLDGITSLAKADFSFYDL
jgi:Ca2+-binding RTX toxin-like protein